MTLGTLERIEKIKNEEEVDGVDLGFINPEEIRKVYSRKEGVQVKADNPIISSRLRFFDISTDKLIRFV